MVSFTMPSMTMWLAAFGDVDDLVFYIFCAVSAVILILFLVNLFIPCCFKRGTGPGSSIDFYMVVGGVLLAFDVLVLGIQVRWTSMDALDALCQLYPSTFLIGLTLFIGGLFVKTWGIYGFFKCYGFKKGKSPWPLRDEWVPNVWMWCLLVLVAAACIVWAILFTPRVAERSFQLNETLVPCVMDDQHAEYLWKLVSSSWHGLLLFMALIGLPGQVVMCVRRRLSNVIALYLCTGPSSFEWTVATTAWHGLLLLLTIIGVPIQCAAAYRSPASRESCLHAAVVLNTLLVVITSLCVAFLYTSATRTLLYAIHGGLCLWMVLFANIVILTSRIVSHRAARNTEENPYDRYDTITEGMQRGSRPNSYGERRGDMPLVPHNTNAGFSAPPEVIKGDMEDGEFKY